jgi:SAM-dependent methyltransferase
MGSMDYVSLVYDEKRTPKTDYPSCLATYLCQRFSLSPGSRFLEIGCGRGDFLRAFQGAGLQCSAVDRASSAVHDSGELDIRLVDASKEPLPFADQCFDTVYSKSLLEHMWDATFLMSEIRRVLRPGGICLILTPDWVSQMATFYEDFTHCRPYTKDSLRDLMKVSGFKSVGTELFSQHPLIWSHSFHRWLAVLLRALLSTRQARKLSRVSGIKFFRWAVELMVLGYGYK